MTRVLYWLIQWTWGIVQNVLGGLLTLLLRRKHARFFGAIVTRWDFRGSMALGMFLFLGRSRQDAPQGSFTEAERRILVHEYGHTVQSCILGPLYLPVIGLPSLLWANLPFFRQRRQKKGRSYYSAYPERWANALGERVTKRPAPTDV